MLSQEHIFEMLRKGEKVTLECKRASQKLPNSVWETYSAMANTYGGIILLGVDYEARNPHIQDLLRMISYGDNLGTGFPEMVEIWENAWGERPLLNERYELQLVELTFGGMKREMPSSENLPENLGELDRRILAEIVANPTVTYDGLAKALEKRGKR